MNSFPAKENLIGRYSWAGEGTPAGHKKVKCEIMKEKSVSFKQAGIILEPVLLAQDVWDEGEGVMCGELTMRIPTASQPGGIQVCSEGKNYVCRVAEAKQQGKLVHEDEFQVCKRECA